MKKIALYMIAASLVIIQGCSDFLDNKPKGITIPSQYEDYEKLLNGINSTVSSTPLYLTDDIKFLDNTASAAGYIYLNQSDEVRNLFSFQPGQIYLAGEKDYLWNEAYDRLFTYNTVINEVVNSVGNSEAQKQRVRAEALIGRALDYLYLVNIYAKQYDPATAATDYGIPYIKEGNINLKYVRNTVAEVYDNIIADINEALPNLSQQVSYTTHPNKLSATALLAKVYLCMGDYQKALACANDVLASKKDLLNLNDYEIKDGVTWGRVHLKGDESAQLPDIYNPEAIYCRFSSGELRTSVLASDDLRQVFKKDLPAESKDLRKEYYFAEDQVNLGRTDYFPGECAYILYIDENLGLTTVETMLIAAECEARTGSKDNAMKWVNLIRDNRISNNVPLSASTNEDAFTKVMQEKRRELCMRGVYRYMDLKRLNHEGKYPVTVTHKVDGQSWTLESNDLRWIFPVNQEILDFNPDMPQYDRK